MAEGLHQGAVVELTDNFWLDLLLGEPALQTAAHYGFRSRNQKRCAVQVAREILAVSRRQLRCGEETDPAFTELLAVAFDVQVRRHRAVGDHQVQTLDRQVGQQTFKLVFAARNAQRLTQFHGRRDQAVDDGFGHHVGHADAKQNLLFIGLRPQHQFQFTAQLKHLLGVG
ncbi:hypothetical protein D3C72_734810 [compost metagenome]